ncbi:MAG: hypothetical protein K2L98_00110, partial [Bacilli bacterium]|nr:hypothetical protein [Bacilli bacterium]
MDPVTLVVIGVVVLAIAPQAIGLGLYGAMHAVQKIKKVFKEHKAYRQRHNKKYQAKAKRTRELKRSIERKRTVAFRNIKTGAIKNVNINECNT